MSKMDQLYPEAREIAEDHFVLVQNLLWQYAPEVTAKLTSTWRSHEEQLALYAKGRTTPGKIVTRALPGQTPHCATMVSGEPAALAWDICLVRGGALLPDDDLLWVLIPVTATLVGGARIKSGAYFKGVRDFPHTELSNWQKLCKDGILVG